VTIFSYSDPAQVSRRVIVGSDRIVTITDSLGSFFPSELINNEGGLASDDASPRSIPPIVLRYRGSYVFHPVGGPLTPGSRVTIRGREYELLSSPSKIRDGVKDWAYEVPVLPVPTLYPLVGALQEQGGAELNASVRFSAYGPSETHSNRGTFEDLSGEAPIELASVINPSFNRQFFVDDAAYKIIEATIDYRAAYVALTLRKLGSA
jgi:hypothetical protein